MVTLNQPAILGFAITPWFITLCVCIIGVMVSLWCVIFAFANMRKKQIEIITEAERNTSKIPVQDIDLSELFVSNGNETESIVEETDTYSIEQKTEEQTEGFGIGTEAFENQEITENQYSSTESFVSSSTEGLENIERTEAFQNFETEGLGAECYGTADNEETEDGALKQKSKYCSRCGNKITSPSKFCSKCGYKIS